LKDGYGDCVTKCGKEKVARGMEEECYNSYYEKKKGGKNKGLQRSYLSADDIQDLYVCVGRKVEGGDGKKGVDPIKSNK